MKRLFIFLGLAAVAAAAWMFAAGPGGRDEAVRVIGSTSIQPFAEMLSEEYARQAADAHVEVQGGGSTFGLQAVANRIAEIGMCSRGLKAEEAEVYEPIVIAHDGLAMVVHPDNPVNALSLEQIREVFAGRTTNWRELGGADAAIHVITREEGSGTREAFQKLVMGEDRIGRRSVTQESNGSVKELVRHDPWSIGYMSMGLTGELKRLSIDGSEPTSANVIAGSYPLVRPFLLVTRKGEGLSEPARRFVEFVMSPRGGAMLEKEGLVAPR